MAQQSPGTCGFQLDRSKVFPPLETLAVWRYGRWWIPGLPVRHLQGEKNKVNSWTTGFSFFSFRISVSESLWEDFLSRVIC